MAKRTFKAGATSQTVDVFIQDSSSTIGAGLSGLAFNTANLKAYYRSGATGAATAITLATQTVAGAWSSGGFVEIDAVNMKGVYRLDVPNAVFASSPSAVIYLYGATNMAPVVVEIEIIAVDLFDAVRMGMTALPNSANVANTAAAIGRGTVAAGGSTTSVPTSALTIGGVAATGVVAGQFNNRVVLFDGNTATAGLRGVAVAISASSASNTPTLTVGTLPTAPAAGDTFSII